ncbi:GAF domain-containing protein [Catellatospora coxensis]
MQRAGRGAGSGCDRRAARGRPVPLPVRGRDEPALAGAALPATSCISGWAMLHDQTVAIPDIRADDRIPQAAYRPTFVRSLLMVPIRVGGVPVGAIGAYWADLHQATAEEKAVLERLAEAAGRALARLSSPVGRTGADRALAV